MPDERGSGGAVAQAGGGSHDRAVALASLDTGRCCDGLTPQGVNRNDGAESTLAFHLAYRAMDTLFWAGGAGEDVEVADADLPI